MSELSTDIHISSLVIFNSQFSIPNFFFCQFQQSLSLTYLLKAKLHTFHQQIAFQSKANFNQDWSNQIMHATSKETSYSLLYIWGQDLCIPWIDIHSTILSFCFVVPLSLFIDDKIKPIIEISKAWTEYHLIWLRALKLPEKSAPSMRPRNRCWPFFREC